MRFGLRVVQSQDGVRGNGGRRVSVALVRRVRIVCQDVEAMTLGELKFTLSRKDRNWTQFNLLEFRAMSPANLVFAPGSFGPRHLMTK